MWSRQHSRACTHSLWPLCIQVLAGGAVAASQLTGTIGSAMAKLSLDDDFVRARERAREGRPKNMVDGLLQGGVGLGRGVAAPNAQLRVLNAHVGGALRGGVTIRNQLTARATEAFAETLTLTLTLGLTLTLDLALT